MEEKGKREWEWEWEWEWMLYKCRLGWDGLGWDGLGWALLEVGWLIVRLIGRSVILTRQGKKIEMASLRGRTHGGVLD